MADLHIAEGKISELEDTTLETNYSEIKKDSKRINKASVNCGITSSGLIRGCVTGVLQGGKADKTFEEIMFPKFPNLMKTINLQTQEDQ